MEPPVRIPGHPFGAKKLLERYANLQLA